MKNMKTLSLLRLVRIQKICRGKLCWGYTSFHNSNYIKLHYYQKNS